MRRLPFGGRIDRSAPLNVSFDGRALPAFRGDTLASAMLAGGLSTVGRSFKYHRPRGIWSAGVEEPNALVHLRQGDRREPNVRATTAEAYDGLVSTSQNAWPSVNFDIGAANDRLSPFFGAGFYYKTFIGPFRRSTRFWMMCETIIRRAAGMGRATHLPDPDSYDKCNAYCDVLVIGSGVAGLSAALAAGRAGAQVILVEQDFALGGGLLSEPVGGDGDQWLGTLTTELEKLENVRILRRTTVFGAYDGDTYGLIESVSDHLPEPRDHQVRQRYWLVRAQRAVLATGTIERPLVFAGNDRPGVMLAGAVRTYLNRFAVLAGETVVVVTNNDTAYVTAADLADAGASVTLADMRQTVAPEIEAIVHEKGITLLAGHGVLEARGRARVNGATVVPVDEQGRAAGATQHLACDLIAISAGWTPALHLWSQRYGKPVFDAAAGTFVAAATDGHRMQPAGTVAACGSVEEIITHGFRRGDEAARTLGCEKQGSPAPSGFRCAALAPGEMSVLFSVSDRDGKFVGKAFVDLQHDVKTSDIDQAHLEGYLSVEHLKRYTTIGMAADQGKTSNVNALALMAALQGSSIAEVGTTTFRPPYTPIAIGAIVGREHGRHFRPTRRSPVHPWHLDHGAEMTEAGVWMRPWYYPEPDEDLRRAYIREAAHVRNYVGMIDVSTLGKIAVQGPDAAEFLNRIYVNGWKKLAVGRLRYGVMLREDGIVMDDGATARLGEHDYFMSTTTVNAARVLAFCEHLLQTAWTDLRVHVTTVTDQWAAFAIAGPRARDLLSEVSDVDLSAETLPNNHFTRATIADIGVRIHRMSYSGELAYEVYVPAGFGLRVWEAIHASGTPFDLIPYGIEAMGALRIEKGHVAGSELDGRTTLEDLGLTSLASTKKPFVGSVLRKRPALQDPVRPALVGLEIDGDTAARAGALLFPMAGETQGHGDGWVSSTTYSPMLGKNIALGFLKGGSTRRGEQVRIVDFVGSDTQNATVVSHHFFDPDGVRQNG